MKNAKQFCEMLNIDEQTTQDIVLLDKKVRDTLNDKIELLAKKALYDCATQEEFLSLLKQAESYGKDIGEHEFRMQLIFALNCFTLLEEKYQKAGISKSVYENTMLDFKFRVYECQEVYHFTGIFVAWWYLIFCNLSLHKIDELEFEKVQAKFDYSNKGVTVKKGDKLLAIHIPPKFKMNKETVTKALKESYKYYNLSGLAVYQCDSWLLYPDFEKVFVEGGNVHEFRSFFDIIDKVDTEEFEDCWRLFKVGKIISLDDLPTSTRLQRNMLDHLKRGGKVGDGFGVLVFDGENIIL